MKRRLSIGSWAYIFNQDKPTNDFHQVVHMLADMGYEGVELGGFNPHPGPDTCDTREKRQALRKLVKDHGLEFSGLAADLWSQKLISVEDSGPYIAAFVKNLFFAEDLGIKTIRVDTVEPITVMKEKNLDPKLVMDRVAKAFDLCSKLAANRGINICWEFEPGFPINKPSEILELVRRVRDEGKNPNFGVLFDSCHAYMCAVVGANQVGAKETLPGGDMELLRKAQGQDHPRPPHRFRRHPQRAQHQHAQSVRHRQAQLRQADPGHDELRRPARLVVRRSVLLAQGLGSDGRQQTLPGQAAAEIRGVIRPLAV